MSTSRSVQADFISNQKAIFDWMLITNVFFFFYYKGALYLIGALTETKQCVAFPLVQ